MKKPYEESLCEILHLKIAILDVFWCHMHQCHLLLLRSSNMRSAPLNQNSTPGTLYHRRYLSSSFQSRGLSFLRFAFSLPLLQCRSGTGIGSATYQLQITSKETLAASWSNDTTNDHVHCSWESLGCERLKWIIVSQRLLTVCRYLCCRAIMTDTGFTPPSMQFTCQLHPTLS